MFIQVDGRFDKLIVFVPELGLEDVVVFNDNVLSGKVEAHGGLCLCGKITRRRIIESVDCVLSVVSKLRGASTLYVFRASADYQSHMHFPLLPDDHLNSSPPLGTCSFARPNQWVSRHIPSNPPRAIRDTALPGNCIKSKQDPTYGGALRRLAVGHGGVMHDDCIARGSLVCGILCKVR